jgi:hypothetical protein
MRVRSRHIDGAASSPGSGDVERQLDPQCGQLVDDSGAADRVDDRGFGTLSSFLLRVC